jgi:hypothetical protein
LRSERKDSQSDYVSEKPRAALSIEGSEAHEYEETPHLPTESHREYQSIRAQFEPEREK